MTWRVAVVVLMVVLSSTDVHLESSQAQQPVLLRTRLAYDRAATGEHRYWAELLRAPGELCLNHRPHLGICLSDPRIDEHLQARQVRRESPPLRQFPYCLYRRDFRCSWT